MGLFDNGSSKLKKTKKRMDTIKQQLEELRAEYDLTKTEYESMTEAPVEQPQHEEPETLKESDENPCNVLQKQIEAKDAIIADYEKRVAELELQLKESASKQPEVELEGPDAASEGGVQGMLDLLKKEIANLSSQLDTEHQRLLKENSDIQDRLDQKQERLEQIIQNCQEDRYRKDKGRLIDRYIYLMNIIRQTLYDYDYNRERILPAGADAEVFLKKQLEAVIVAMNATLDSEKVVMLPVAPEGSTVDTNLQEIIDVVPTENSNLDGKVYRSVNPGYAWTLPYILRAKTTDTDQNIKNYKFLIRAEQVIVYKFNKK